MPGQVAPLLGLGATLLGALLVVLGVRALVGSRRRRRTWLPCPGRVVATRLDDGQVRSQVAYLRDGAEVRFWNRYTSSVVRDPVGRDVTVLVNPDDPHDAVVSGGLVGGSTVGVVLVLAGALMVVVGVVVGAGALR